MSIASRFFNLANKHRAATVTFIYVVLVVALLFALAPRGFIKWSFIIVVPLVTALSMYFGSSKGLFLGLGFVCAFVVIDYVSLRLGGWYFHDVPVEMISIALATNVDEIKNALYFSKRETLFLVIFIISILWPVKVKGLSRSKILFFSLFSMVMGGVTIASFWPVRKAYENFNQKSSFLFDNEKSIASRKAFTWGAEDVSGTQAQTVVIFLGETHRGDHLQINGYPRETTPRLMNWNVVTFKDAVSQGQNTLDATPMIMSRKKVTDRGVFGEKSLIAAFREAGYETWYVSYLAPSHIGDTEINLIANDADHYIISRVNVDVLKGILKSKAKKKLIIYKTVGSHTLYHTRYPAEFEIFKPSYTSIKYKVPKPAKEDIELLNNSYDNATLYSVDYHVDSFLRELNLLEEPVAFSFIADHGTVIFEDGKSLYYGCTKPNYSIGYFFWFNRAYEKRNEDKVKQLRDNSEKAVSSESFVDTMLDLASIKTKIRKGISLVDKKFKPKNRVVRCHGRTLIYEDIR